MEWLSEKKTAHKEKKARIKQEAMDCMSCKVINVIEFDGKLYVSHNGVPIIPVESLNSDVEKVVAESRKSYLTWRAKFDA